MGDDSSLAAEVASLSFKLHRSRLESKIWKYRYISAAFCNYHCDIQLDEPRQIKDMMRTFSELEKVYKIAEQSFEEVQKLVHLVNEEVNSLIAHALYKRTVGERGTRTNISATSSEHVIDLTADDSTTTTDQTSSDSAACSSSSNSINNAPAVDLLLLAANPISERETVSVMDLATVDSEESRVLSSNKDSIGQHWTIASHVIAPPHNASSVLKKKRSRSTGSHDDIPSGSPRSGISPPAGGAGFSFDSDLLAARLNEALMKASTANAASFPVAASSLNMECDTVSSAFSFLPVSFTSASVEAVAASASGDDSAAAGADGADVYGSYEGAGSSIMERVNFPLHEMKFWCAASSSADLGSQSREVADDRKEEEEEGE